MTTFAGGRMTLADLKIDYAAAYEKSYKSLRRKLQEKCDRKLEYFLSKVERKLLKAVNNSTDFIQIKCPRWLADTYQYSDIEHILACKGLYCMPIWLLNTLEIGVK